MPRWKSPVGEGANRPVFVMCPVYEAVAAPRDPPPRVVVAQAYSGVHGENACARLVGGLRGRGRGDGCARGLDEVAKASPVRGLFLSWSTLTVNAVGAFLLGALAAWVAGRLARGSRNTASLKSLKLLVGTGFAGAFTTYGTYIVASVGYASLNGIVEAVSQSLGLLALGGACAWAGMRVGEWLCSRTGVQLASGEEGRA